jgi:hypothetical protein
VAEEALNLSRLYLEKHVSFSILLADPPSMAHVQNEPSTMAETTRGKGRNRDFSSSRKIKSKK